MAKWLRRPLSKREIASSILAKSITLFLLLGAAFCYDVYANDNGGVCYFNVCLLGMQVVLQVFFARRSLPRVRV